MKVAVRETQVTTTAQGPIAYGQVRAAHLRAGAPVHRHQPVRTLPVRPISRVVASEHSTVSMEETQ